MRRKCTSTESTAIRVRGRDRAQDGHRALRQGVERHQRRVEPAPKQRIQVVAAVGGGHLDALGLEARDRRIEARRRLTGQRRLEPHPPQRERDLGRPGVARTPARLRHVGVEEQHRLPLPPWPRRRRPPPLRPLDDPSRRVGSGRLAGGAHAQVDGLADALGEGEGGGCGEGGQGGFGGDGQLAIRVNANWPSPLPVPLRLHPVPERPQEDVALVDPVGLDAVADGGGGHVAAGAQAEAVDVGRCQELLAAEGAALAGAEADVEAADGVERFAPDRPVGAEHLGPAGEVEIGVTEGEHAEEGLHAGGRPAGGTLGRPQRMDGPAGDRHRGIGEGVAQALDPAGRGPGVVVEVDQHVVSGGGGTRVSRPGEPRHRFAHEPHALGQLAPERLHAVVDDDDLAAGEHAVGDARLDALAHLVRPVAGAHDHAHGRPGGDPLDERVGHDHQAPRRGGEQHLLVALAGVGERLALDPPPPRRRQAVERERIGRGLAGGERPQAAVAGDAVAAHLVGAASRAPGQRDPARHCTAAVSGSANPGRGRAMPESAMQTSADAAPAAAASAARRPIGRSLRWMPTSPSSRCRSACVSGPDASSTTTTSTSGARSQATRASICAHSAAGLSRATIRIAVLTPRPP